MIQPFPKRWRCAGEFPILLGLVLLAAGLFVDDDESLGWVTLIGLAVTAIATACLAGQKTVTFNGTFALDGYAVFFDLLFLFTGIVVVLMSMTYLEGTGIPSGDYYGLVAFAIAVRDPFERQPSDELFAPSQKAEAFAGLWLALTVAGTVTDIVTSPRSARRYNERHLQIAPMVATPSGASPGVSLGFAF